MKTKFFALGLLGTVVATLVLTGTRSGEISSAQAQPAPPSGDVQPSSAALPPNIPSVGPLAQVIKLTQAGVDESIILTYISNSASTFNLDADKIIYLNDVGVPNLLVGAMMQRDQILQTQFAAASPPPTPETTATYATEVEPQPEPEVVTVNYFNDSLSPYGNWVNVEGYGRCWRPTVVVYNSGWSPYCDRGRWVYTDSGWYWNSDYSWGVTFHYGRWFRDTRYGWCWWPDTVWAPSWVTWRYSDDYCGWAPVPPFAVWQTGIGFVYRGNGVSVGFDFGLASDCFTFVSASHFCDPPHRYRCAPAEVTRIYNRTTVINNFNFDSHNRTVVNNGIAVQHIAAATHTTIRPVAARELRQERPEQLRRNVLNAQPENRPGATAGNSSRPGSGFENRNIGAANTGTSGQNGFGHPSGNPDQQVNRNWTAPAQNPAEPPAQNRFSQPANNQNPPPYRNGSENVQSPSRNFQDDKRITSPHAQQSETPSPSAAVLAERFQARMDARQNSPESPRISQPQPPAPASQPAAQPSQPSSRSDKQDQNQNQNNRGH